MSSRQVKIAASILAADFARLGEQVQEAEVAGANWIHIDVMDGRFVPNITMGPLVVEAVRKITNLPLDVHLMIVEPEKYIQQFAEAGADSISVHLEASPNLHRTLQAIRELDCKVGVAINPHTGASALSEVIHMLDLINVMTVNPGFGGQTLIEATLPKIRQLKTMTEQTEHGIDLEVDGGVNSETVKQMVDAGANVLVVGSAIFNSRYSVKAGVDSIKKAMI